MSGVAPPIKSLWLNRQGVPPAWFFGVTALSLGATGSFALSGVPFMFQKAGIQLEQIGWYAMAMTLPLSLTFVYAALTDIGFRWKTWVVLLAVLTTLALSTALSARLPAGMTLILTCTFVSQICSSLSLACQSALASTRLQGKERDQGAGWMVTGGLIGGTLGTFLVVDLFQYREIRVAGWLYTLLIFLPAASMFLVPEPVRRTPPLRELLRSFVAELRQIMRLKETWAGVLVCTLPTGTWAVMFFLPSLGTHYQASPGTIASVNGAASWILSAIGAAAAGLLCMRVHRYWVYIGASLCAILIEVILALGPARPATYVACSLGFFLMQGMQMCATEAVIFSVLRHSRQSTCLQFNLLRSVNYFSVVYVTFIDTKMSNRYGVTGLLLADALLMGIGLLMLALFIRLFKAPEQP